MKHHIWTLIFLINFSLTAQNSIITNQEYSISIGLADVNINRFTLNENIDFLNYLGIEDDIDSNTGYYEYPYILVKHNYKADLFSKIAIDLNLILFESLIPDNYDVSARYFLKPWLGIGAGSMLNKNWISGFEQYHKELLPDHYLGDLNHKQIKVYELGFYLSPTFKPIDNKNFRIQIKCDIGLSSFSQKETSFNYKKKLSNKRIRYYYATKENFQPYFWPKIDAKLKVFTIKETSFGFVLNSNYYYSNRSIDYNRTIQTWTLENKTSTLIRSHKHQYTRFELNIGIYVAW